MDREDPGNSIQGLTRILLGRVLRREIHSSRQPTAAKVFEYVLKRISSAHPDGCTRRSWLLAAARRAWRHIPYCCRKQASLARSEDLLGCGSL